MTRPLVLPLREREKSPLNADELSSAAAEAILHSLQGKVEIEWPTPKTGGKWELTSLGWVGYVPLSDDLHLSLTPKVSLGNIFRMLEYAYEIKLDLRNDVFESESMEDFYNRLAVILAGMVLRRTRKGIHRDYVSEADTLAVLRGRLDIDRQLQAAWKVGLACQYQEHTADIEDNQILIWTLYCIASSGICTAETLRHVRKAFHTLDGSVSLKTIPANACLQRLYHRLNQDYQPLHALCHFFLEQSGPTHRPGGRNMLPFLINMDHLFERFVARWLERHLPDTYRLKIQESVTLNAEQNIRVQIDMLLIHARTNETLCVLDTKYKTDKQPSSSDMEQVIAYADIMNCRQAALVYPSSSTFAGPSNVRGRTQVRTMVFDLDGDLEANGQRFLQQLLA